MSPKEPFSISLRSWICDRSMLLNDAGNCTTLLVDPYALAIRRCSAGPERWSRGLRCSEPEDLEPEEELEKPWLALLWRNFLTMKTVPPTSSKSSSTKTMPTRAHSQSGKRRPESTGCKT